MTAFSFGPPQPIGKAHQTQGFDCGQEPLNDFLQRFALANSQSGSAKTFVVTDSENRVVGYYSLAATSIVYENAPIRLQQGQPRHPIPAILMARFAVDISQQGQGLGRALFRDALLRCLNVTDEIGARVFVVDAKDENALRFYRKFGMLLDPNDPQRLYLLFKDVKKVLSSQP